MMNSSGLIAPFLQSQDLNQRLFQLSLRHFYVCDYVRQPGIYPQYTAASAGSTVP